MIEEFCEIFEYLKQRMTCSPNYSLKRKKKDVQLIEKFFFNSKINSIEELWQYLLFQFVLSENNYSNRYSLTLTKIISLNALKRWNERTKEKLFYVSKFQRDRSLVNPLKGNNSEHIFSDRYKDFLRHKFWNTPKGFIFCGEYNGILFNELKCKDCYYYNACKNGRFS